LLTEEAMKGMKEASSVTKKDTSKKIAIGPLILQITGFGGVQRHILNIMDYSKYDLKPITPLLSSYSRYLRPASSLLTTRKVSFLDVYGLFYSKLLLPCYDIVHLHGHPEWPGLYSKPRKKKAQYIHTVHGIYTQEDYPDDWDYRSLLNERMLNACKESDVVIAVARWLKAWLKEAGVDALYIPNGINVAEFTTAHPADFRAKFAVSDDFYLFAGRLDEYKRPNLFIYLAERITDRKFVMVGRDLTPDKVRNYYGADLPQNLTCLGELTREDLINAFSACSVFILTSKYDTFPSVLLEAMACKKVVVGANNAGPKEIITDGTDGYLFEPDDIDDLYDKALKAWDTAVFGESGFEKVKEKFDWKGVVKQIDGVYERLVQ